MRLACRAVLLRPARLVVERLVPIEAAEAEAQGHDAPLLGAHGHGEAMPTKPGERPGMPPPQVAYWDSEP